MREGDEPWKELRGQMAERKRASRPAAACACAAAVSTASFAAAAAAPG